ncbi:hypothetical protein [Aequorivita sp. Q41]|uniref:hypothetical protein n=1 Tax=Aequorivita sp. Q41 TaxID=3153300 RepID=UPI00324248E4
MKNESSFDQIKTNLNKLKNQPFSDEKINSLIEIIDHQNDQAKSIFEDMNRLMDSHKDSLEMLLKGTNSANNALESIFKWMNAQNNRNDSVDIGYGELIQRIDKLEK